MITKKITLVFFALAFMNMAYAYQITQQAHLHGGAAYLVNENPDSNIGYHGITVGQPVVGSASSENYTTHFGMWSF